MLYSPSRQLVWPEKRSRVVDDVGRVDVSRGVHHEDFGVGGRVDERPVPDDLGKHARMHLGEDLETLLADARKPARHQAEHHHLLPVAVDAGAAVVDGIRRVAGKVQPGTPQLLVRQEWVEPGLRIAHDVVERLAAGGAVEEPARVGPALDVNADAGEKPLVGAVRRVQLLLHLAVLDPLDPGHIVSGHVYPRACSSS